jgi:hypothetical protein
MSPGDVVCPLPQPSTGGRYDPDEQLVLQPLNSPGYHTTITSGLVHPTRESLTYAADLFAMASQDAAERGSQILRRVLSLQDQDPASRTYGIWSWFLEEPLPKMSPPDWNWADFCSVPLLEISTARRDQLDDALASKVDAAIGHAARSIERRNMGPAYTNIAVMGTYVSLAAAQHLRWSDLTDYALGRLRRLHEYTTYHGAFTEYNSPNYTMVTLRELGRLRGVAPEGEPRRMAEALYRLAWEEVAQHFHPPTRQWAGPHSRSYSTLLKPETLAIIEQGSGGQLSLLSDAQRQATAPSRQTLPMPEDLLPMFQAMPRPRELVRTLLRDTSPLVETSYLHPGFAVGSINHADMWRQQRPLVAYWGTAQSPSYLRLRFLRNGDDLHAAHFHSVQAAGRVLAAIHFATDQGVLHPFFDRMTDGIFTAEDLRLRFEFGGAAAHATLTAPTDLLTPVRLSFGDLQIHLSIPFAHFGASSGQWEVSPGSGVANLDIVLYRGPEKKIRMADVQPAAIGLAVQFSAGQTAQAPAPVQCDWTSDRLNLRCAGLGLSLQATPATRDVLLRGVQATRNEP